MQATWLHVTKQDWLLAFHIAGKSLKNIQMEGFKVRETTKGKDIFLFIFLLYITTFKSYAQGRD